MQCVKSGWILHLDIFKIIQNPIMEEGTGQIGAPQGKSTSNSSSLGGIRRNINVLEPNERKQYFWCLKMLGILPPFEEMKKRVFRPSSFNISKQVPPTCLHDELIANHATCCEHQSFYFAYYHRHLMILFELRLNYADEVLRLSPQQFQTKFKDLYSKNEALWNEVLRKYQRQIAPKEKKQVMAHYWNPTNYNCRDDVVIPEEVANPLYFKRKNPKTGQLQSYKPDQMDALFKAVNGVYCYEINEKTRFQTAKDHEQGNEQKPIESIYDDPYQKLVTGQITPRTQRDTMKFNKLYRHLADYGPRGNTSIQQQLSYQYDLKNHEEKRSTFYKVQVQKGLKQKMTANGKGNGKYDLLSLNEGEILVNYGGRYNTEGIEYQYHYFNKAELKEDPRQYHLKVAYNQMLPHYQIGYALLNRKFDSLSYFFDDKSGFNNQRSHAFLHNRMNSCLNDAQFSLTNLMFFPYHSWIDIQIEMKLRLCHTPCEANRLKYYMEHNNALDPPTEPRHKQVQIPIKDYYIYQWYNPVNKQRIRPIKGYSYILRGEEGEEEVRTSLNLQEYYQQNYFNTPDNIKIYEGFEGYRNYNANYDYQMFEVTEVVNGKETRQTYMLGDKENTRIPKYLRDMQEQVNTYEARMAKKIQDIISKDTVFYQETPKFYRKLIDKRFTLLVRHNSSIKNGVYTFEARIAGLLDFIKTKGYTLSKAKELELRKDWKENIFLFQICQLGKEQSASDCPNCQEYVYRAVNVNQQIGILIDGQRGQSQKIKQQEKDKPSLQSLWNFFNIVLLKNISSNILDQKQSDHSVNVAQFIITESNDIFDLSYIEGAEELSIEFNLKSNATIWGAQVYITLDAHQILDSKISEQITKKFDKGDLKSKNGILYVDPMIFINLPSKDTSRNSPGLKRMIYYQVTVSVYINGMRKDFSFPIRHYHENIRYVIQAEVIYQSLTVKVLDKDKKFKEQFYE